MAEDLTFEFEDRIFAPDYTGGLHDYWAVVPTFSLHVNTFDLLTVEARRNVM
jgi:hypothetical protein